MRDKGRYSLVTGASGFIGRALCERLVSQNSNVLAMTRLSCDLQECQPWVCDISDVIDGNRMTSVDTVFHLAAKGHALTETKQDEAEYFRINTEGTRKLLGAAKKAGVRRFVFFSSIKAMGEGGHECLDESAICNPQTPYGRSKLEAEHLVLNGGYVPEPVVLRLSMVYGADSKGNLPQMIRAVSRGFFPPLPEFNNKRSMVHVQDVVRAAVLASDKTEAVNQTYIVTDGQAYSTRHMYEWICETMGKQASGWSIPVGILNSMAKLGDAIGVIRGKRFIFDSDALEKIRGSACYSSEKIRQDLGFQAEYHLHEALPDIVRYCQS